MSGVYREFKKHLKIYCLLMKISLIGYMEYRANFFAALTMEIVYLISKIIYVIVIYQTGISISGVTPDEIMLFIGTYIIMTAIYTGLFMENFYQIPEHIRNGTLDIYIVKPLSLQFIATLRHVNFVLPVPNLIAGITLVAMACRNLHVGIDLMAGYLGILFCSTCIAYALFLAPMLLSFWTVKSDAIREIVDKCWDFNNMPMFIYNKWMQTIGIFIIPLFFITNLPAMYLTDKLDSMYVIWIIAAPIVFLSLTRCLWSFAIRKYTSACS